MNLSKVGCLIAVLAAAAGLQGAYVNGELLWEGDFTTREGAARAGKEALEHFRPDAGPDGKGALVFRTRRNTETDWIRIPLPAGETCRHDSAGGGRIGQRSGSRRASLLGQQGDAQLPERRKEPLAGNLPEFRHLCVEYGRHGRSNSR